jgi:hypothetical protein
VRLSLCPQAGGGDLKRKAGSSAALRNDKSKKVRDDSSKKVRDGKLKNKVKKVSLAAQVDVVDFGYGLAEEVGAEALEFFD